MISDIPDKQHFVSFMDIFFYNGEHYMISKIGIETLDNIDKLISSIPDQISIAEQIAHGLFTLKQKCIAHLDLIPSNIQLHRSERSGYEAKIGGFQHCRNFSKNETEVKPPSYFSINSPPEFFIKDQTYKWTPEDFYAADIYSFGCILYELISGRHPFKHLANESETTRYAKMKEAFSPNLSTSEIFPLNQNEIAKNFKLVKLDTINSFVELIRGCLTFYPKTRLRWERIISILQELPSSIPETKAEDLDYSQTVDDIYNFLINEGVSETICIEFKNKKIDGIKFANLLPEDLDFIDSKKGRELILEIRDEWKQNQPKTNPQSSQTSSQYQSQYQSQSQLQSNIPNCND